MQLFAKDHLAVDSRRRHKVRITPIAWPRWCLLERLKASSKAVLTFNADARVACSAGSADAIARQAQVHLSTVELNRIDQLRGLGDDSHAFAFGTHGFDVAIQAGKPLNAHQQ